MQINSSANVTLTGLPTNFAIPVIMRDLSLVAGYKKKFSDAEVEIRPMIAGNMARQPFYRKYVGNPGNQPHAEFIHFKPDRSVFRIDPMFTMTFIHARWRESDSRDVLADVIQILFLPPEPGECMTPR